ncbi:uncharacterized protein BYT42DRAFT_565984 [Radiomyces spectabilis]|uniref:uncharacterized protein n=1 Tax=Radiomyces spectabilis TaxID=64574 RepID=UPI00221E490D|nr:uncharacterized protein BYT42DRAFT_565984 [Radiomyces spectabilis]KAI8381286.1 hypothetical protein BYT42DRAFT_565984 [Radiomyces spectabilis]
MDLSNAVMDTLQDPLKHAVAPLLTAFYNLFYLLYNYLVQPWMRIWRRIKHNKPENRLLHSLRHADDYESWRTQAQELDSLLQNDLWKSQPVSRLYDYKLISSRLEHLQNARASDDVECVIYLLRGGLLRNFGGICERKLFSHSYYGTKNIVEEYMDEVVKLIEYIESKRGFNQQAKLKFFSDSRQGFGCSALVLQGGSAFALYHLGVVKALNEQGLLPRIISGTAIGAMIAALICIHTDDELPHVLQPDGINLTAFSKKTDQGHIRRRITRFLKHGYLMDMKVLQECVRANVGDLTFEEAYARSNRVLNISVSSSRTQEVPQLLNHLTAPNVLIWSAACCSTASVGLFESCDLLAKDKNGNVVKWNPSAVKWNQWSEASPTESETPLYRLSELFNVNHFIVSQASPYIIPFISKADNLQHASLWNKLVYVAASELKHRLYQLNQLHLLPRVFRGLIEQKMSGNVNIVPHLALSDYNILFSNPTHASLAYWIMHGERSTWPLISLIKARCMIELALDRAVRRLKAMNVEKQPIVIEPSAVETKKRARSMH